MAANSSHGFTPDANFEIDTADPAVQVDALQELVCDMLATFVNAGQLTPADAAPWWDAASAVALNRPELLDSAVAVVAEAEAVTRVAARD